MIHWLFFEFCSSWYTEEQPVVKKKKILSNTFIIIFIIFKLRNWKYILTIWPKLVKFWLILEYIFIGQISILCGFHYKNVPNPQISKLKSFNIRLRNLLYWLDLTARTEIYSKHKSFYWHEMGKDPLGRLQSMPNRFQAIKIMIRNIHRTSRIYSQRYILSENFMACTFHNF